MCARVTLEKTSPPRASIYSRSPWAHSSSLEATCSSKISQIGKVCHTRCAIYYLAGDCIFPHEGIFGVVLKGGEVHTGDDIQVVKLGDGSCSFTPAEALEEIEQAHQKGTL